MTANDLTVIVLSFQTEIDGESGHPKDELAPETLTWFKTLGVEYKKLSEVIAAGPCPKVIFQLIFIARSVLYLPSLHVTFVFIHFISVFL